MLTYKGNNFSVGRAEFLTSLPGVSEGTSKIFLRIVPAPLDTEVFAQVDTGSPWLILEPEILAALDLLDTSGEPVSLKTRFGEMRGHLERTTITLLADEGESIDVDATVFVCAEWPAGMNFVGYTGLLERIRFAVDSGTSSFFFGPTA